MPVSLPSIRSYAVTFRPHGGVTDKQIDDFTAFCGKYCTYYSIVTEKEDDERHIHAGLFLKKKVDRSSFCTQLIRKFPDLSYDEKAVLRKGIKFMYNIDFVKNYMDKDDDTVVVANNLPETATLDSYFAEVPNPKKRGPSSADPYYSNLEKLWYLHKRPEDECNPNNIRHFLMNMMNKERIIRVISDNRKVFSLSCALARYINEETSWNVECEPFHQDV